MDDNKLTSMLTERMNDIKNETLHNNDVSLCQSSLQNPDHQSKTNVDNSDIPVVSEIPITGGQLHSIAAGNYCLIGQKGEPFAVRFMLKSSFKVPGKNFVMRNVVMQIVAVGKDNVMRRKDMATDIRVVKSKPSVKPKQDKDDMKFEVNDSKKSLF